jgi:hypothetical protein
VRLARDLVERERGMSAIMRMQIAWTRFVMRLIMGLMTMIPETG